MASFRFLLPSDLHSDYFICSGDKVIPLHTFSNCVVWWETQCDVVGTSAFEVCVQYRQQVDENCLPLSPPVSSVYETDKLTPHTVLGVIDECP